MTGVQTCALPICEADLIATYQKRYDDAMALLMNLGNGKDRSDAYRSGQYRVPAR